MAEQTEVRRDSGLFAALASHLLARGLSFRFRAAGESMRPAICDGECVEVVPARTAELRRGDILLTRDVEGIKAHRLVSSVSATSSLQTRGDASRTKDTDRNTKVLGRVVSVERKGRRLELGGSARVLLQAVQRTGFCLHAAIRARVGRLGSAGAAFLLTALVFLLAAPSAQAQADLSVTETVAPSVVAPGGTITYTITVHNAGPNAGATSRVFMITPANTTFSAVVCAAGWTCTNHPPAGIGGNITLTRTSFPAGTTSVFTIILNVAAGTPAGTTILQNVNVASNTSDPNGQDNAAAASVLVELPGDADMALSMTANPSTVFVSANYTYNITLTDFGLANAANVMVTDTLPASVTFVSAVPSQGSCSGTTTITCSLGTVNASASATVTITVTSPATAAMISNSASVSTTTTDPVASNNSATVIVTVQPIVCATPARDGTGGTLTGTVNTYYPPGGPFPQVVAAGAKSVALGAASGAATPIASGDLVLIIQMQDAAINSTNTGAYGDGSPGDPGSGSTALNSSGLYEFVVATSGIPVAGGTLNFTGTGSGGGLLNTYNGAAYIAGTMGQRTFQAIRVPQYQTAAVGSALTALAWNGTVGGVLAVDVAGQLSLNSTTVTMDTLGFRGGAGKQLTGPGTAGSANTDYVTLSTNPINASKGEGIAGTPAFVANAALTNLINTGVEGYPNGSYGRGAPGNAGGGGTDGDVNANTENSGAGGGGNGGTGGIGGYAWNLPGVGQGFGGVAYPATISGVVMGGGGGAGTTNNGTADPANGNPPGINSSGAAGGGILLIRSGSVVGTGTVSANGQTALNTLNDAGGGGGAGGSIIFLALSGGLGTLTANAKGGIGGSTWRTQAPGGYPGQRHGPGGGGGGGVILLSGGATTSAMGGLDGITDTDGDSFGSLPGTAGIVQTTIAPSTTAGVRSGAECALADLQLTNSGTPNPVLPGGTITYTQVVTNAGPQDAVNVTFNEQVPANTTFASLPTPPGWMCVTPAVGGTGAITCTNPNLANAGTATFTLAVTVGAAVTSGTIITDVANVTSGINDPNFANNTATVQTLVSAATSADLAASETASPNPVLAGSQVTFLMKVVNNGPAASGFSAINVATIPANTTFQSLTTPASWSCTTPAVGGTGNVYCTIAGLASGYSGTFTLVLNVAAGAASGTVITNTFHVGSFTPDALPANNDASASVVVATAGQADLAISGSVSPNPVLAGKNITYPLTVTNNGPAAASTLTFTDVLPANTNFQSLVSPGGWMCMTPAVGASGTITCTIASLAANSSANFTVVLQANATTPAGTAITNTPMISATTGDPTAANNSVALTTFVTVPNQADVAVTKSGSPNPVNQNTTLVYTIQVSNNGPAVATNVMAVDTLPSAVTYVSSSSSQNTCVQAAGTVTCNIGTMSVGQVVLINITVTASTFSSATLATNSVTISHGEGDPDTANNTSTFTSTIQASTAVQLAAFHAVRLPDGEVQVEWRTREEVRNLGFHLYRLSGGQKTRIDTSLIAGAALTFRGGLPQHGAKTYRWIDPNPGAVDAEYELESVDVAGTRATHGPASIEAGEQPWPSSAAVAPAAARRAREAASSATLAQIGRTAGAAPSSPVRLSQARPIAGGEIGAPSVSNAALAVRPAVKISVDHEGWYRVTGAQLMAAGLPTISALRSLHLYAEGVEQPILVDGVPSGTLGPDDAIEFYGTGIDTPFSGTRIYWLTVGEGPGTRIGMEPKAHGSSTAPSSFPYTVVREDRTTYFAALLNGENNDNFFGALVTSEPVEQDLTVAHSDPSFSSPALQVSLQGVTDQQAHRVSVTLNGTYLGEIDFNGQAGASQTFPLAAGQVLNGTNAVMLGALEGDNDVSLVQSIQLLYGHAYAADGNWLRMTASAGEAVSVTGFSNAQVEVFDITDPTNIGQLATTISGGSSGYAATFVVKGTAGSTRTLLAFSADQMESPAALAHHEPTEWGQRQRGADVVMITHPDFASSLTPLVNLRRSQGHTVAVVTVDELYDEFNFGERSPFALRSFLSAAGTEWRKRPQFVLLVGDASFDPRNYLGLGDFDFVPTRIIETAALKTSSDDWFSDFQGTGFATLATGRLPVRTAADIELAVSKITGYETGASPGAWSSQVLLIGDQNTGYDFSSATNLVSQLVPPGLGVNKILADGQPSGTVQQQLIEQLNSGQLLVNFLGHGSVEQWSFTDFFSNADATALTNAGNLPVVLSMDCLSGFFHDVYTTSLAESLLLAPNGGAVAVWASSGFTTPDPQATMNRALVSLLFSQPHLPLGRAILNVKQGTVDSDVRRTWILFGDPAMQLRLPQAQPGSAGSRR